MTNQFKYGPVSFSQLSRLAAEGRIQPTDMVLKKGTPQWVEARSLSQLKFQHVQPQRPLVPCEKCKARLSDKAETCPQCGHPQPKLQPGCGTTWWSTVAECEACGVLNRFEFFRHYDPNMAQLCRACQRPLKETTEKEYIRHDMLQTYRHSVGWVRGGAAVIAVLGFFFGCMIGGGVFPQFKGMVEVLVGIVGAAIGCYLGRILVEHWVLKSQASRRTFLSDQSHRIRFVYLPKHTSWLNQIEIVFGVITRKVIRRGNFRSVDDLKDKLRQFIDYFNEVFAKPFRWTFTGRPLQT